MGCRLCQAQMAFFVCASEVSASMAAEKEGEESLEEKFVEREVRLCPSCTR